MLYAKAEHNPEGVTVILWNKIRFIILKICKQMINGKPKGKTLCRDLFWFSNMTGLVLTVPQEQYSPRNRA